MLSILVGRAILRAAAFLGGQSRLKAGCGQDWPPHKVSGPAPLRGVSPFRQFLLIRDESPGSAAGKWAASAGRILKTRGTVHRTPGVAFPAADRSRPPGRFARSPPRGFRPAR